MIDPKALAQDTLIKPEFLLELKANDMTDSGLKNYYFAVKTLREIGKKPENLTKKDLVEWSSKMKDRYAKSTWNLYKAYVKRYLKWLHTGELDDGEYPDCVKWMKTDNANQDLPKEILSHKEIKRMAESTDSQRNRTMIWVGYESGCRPGELLNMRVSSVDFDEYGAKVHLMERLER